MIEDTKEYVKSVINKLNIDHTKEPMFLEKG